jgi:hypothetical protein
VSKTQPEQHLQRGSASWGEVATCFQVSLRFSLRFSLLAWSSALLSKVIWPLAKVILVSSDGDFSICASDDEAFSF